jgi:hypothetical protein
MFAVVVARGFTSLSASRLVSARRLWRPLTYGAAASLFFINYKFDNPVDCVGRPHGNSFEYLEFAGRVLAHALHADLIGGPAATSLGLLLLVALMLILISLAAGLILRRVISEDALLEMYVLTCVLAFAGTTAIGRVCSGPDGAWAWRYYVYSAPLLVLFAFSPPSSPSSFF